MRDTEGNWSGDTESCSASPKTVMVPGECPVRARKGTVVCPEMPEVERWCARKCARKKTMVCPEKNHRVPEMETGKWRETC